MGNPHKGEVSFEAFGKTYIFKLGTDAQARLERREKKPFFQLFRRGDDEWGMDSVLSIFHAGLYRKHQLTEEQAADLIDEIGVARAGEIIAEAMQLAFGEGKDNENPPILKLHGSGNG